MMILKYPPPVAVRQSPTSKAVGFIKEKLQNLRAVVMCVLNNVEIHR